MKRLLLMLLAKSMPKNCGCPLDELLTLCAEVSAEVKKAKSAAAISTAERRLFAIDKAYKHLPECTANTLRVGNEIAVRRLDVVLLAFHFEQHGRPIVDDEQPDDTTTNDSSFNSKP